MTVLLADAFAALRACREGDCDVIISDPPYGAHVQDNLCSGSLVGTKSVPKYRLPFPPLESYVWVHDAVRAAKRWVVLFSDLEGLGRYQMTAPEAYVRGAIWAKPNAMGQLTADRPATAYEGLALLHTKATKKRWNGKGSYGIWKCNGTRGKKGRHPNEKPLDLALKLVALFSDRGETVFDPFCGSAVIGEACVRLGRIYVGLDNSEEWVEKARARVSAASDLPPVTDEYALGLCRAFGKDASEDAQEAA